MKRYPGHHPERPSWIREKDDLYPNLLFYSVDSDMVCGQTELWRAVEDTRKLLEEMKIRERIREIAGGMRD